MTAPRMGRACILVVEDEPTIREALVELLQDEGFDVTGVANGQEAHDYLLHAADTPELILLDLLMPVMDGRQFLMEQLRRPAIAGIPVVLLSATDTSHLELPVHAVAGYLDKPLQLDEVVGLVEQFCPAEGSAPL